MEDRANIEILFRKYIDGIASKEEVEELLSFFQTEENESEINELIKYVLAEQSFPKTWETLETRKRIFDSKQVLLAAIKPQKPIVSTRKLGWWAIATAASILLIATFSFIYFGNKRATQEVEVGIVDVFPGSNKAVLTLSNGKKISLTDAENGQLAEQSGVRVSKTKDGMIVYSTVENSKNYSAYNTIETPRGGEFQVVLPDGSKVWLNAASSLKYPLSFGALKERKVELSGEAYFEVVHNKSQPFRVATSGQTVEVLGTHFNVNSYADEKKTTTTLEEGSIKVYNKRQAETIKPGEQTLLNRNGDIVVQEADLQTALAWKNGKIKFRDADIKTIMRQISRWYDIEVEYQGDLPERSFNGGVDRTAKLSSLLKILELNNIHFTIQRDSNSKKLIVKP